jgi:hypothetical protein
MDGFEVVAGIGLLLAVKFFAYAWYLRLLDRRWNASRNAWTLSALRIALGAALAALALAAFPGGGRDTFLGTYFFALGAGRVLAWGGILGFAFRRHASPGAIALAVVPAVILSYAVEIPILVGLIDAIGIC